VHGSRLGIIRTHQQNGWQRAHTYSIRGNTAREPHRVYHGQAMLLILTAWPAAARVLPSLWVACRRAHAISSLSVSLLATACAETGKTQTTIARNLPLACVDNTCKGQPACHVRRVAVHATKRTQDPSPAWRPTASKPTYPTLSRQECGGWLVRVAQLSEAR
jgi:hypothetical protein